jgi:hypothetical protein
MEGERLRLLAEPAANLDEAQPEGTELRACDPGLDQEPTQRVEQPVGGGVQQQTELVGSAAMAAEAIGEAGVLEVFDPVLRLVPTHVPVVEGERREIGPSGHH